MQNAIPKQMHENYT